MLFGKQLHFGGSYCLVGQAVRLLDTEHEGTVM